MPSINELNLLRIQSAFKTVQVKLPRSNQPSNAVECLVEAILTELPSHPKCLEAAMTLAWFALDTVSESADGQMPTVSLRAEDISRYLVFARIYKCRPVLKGQTWGFAHHMTKVMGTLNRMAEVEMIEDIESFKPSTSESFLLAQLPVPSRNAGRAITEAIAKLKAEQLPG
jgi:hypothetical protein